MTNENDHKEQRPKIHLIWSLFDHVLSEMGSSAHEKGLRHDYSLGATDLTESLKQTASYLGLKFNELTLTIDQAAAYSGQLTPVMKFVNDSWLVLSGYSHGLIKVAIVKGSDVNIQLKNIKSLVEILDCDRNMLMEWYALELKAPMESAAHSNHGHLPPLKRLFAMMEVEKEDLWRVVLLAMASGLLSLATPAAVQSLVNTVALGGMLQPLLILSVMLFIFLAFFGAVSVLQSYIVELIQRRVFVRMASDLSYRLPKVNREIYDEKNGAELVNRFFDVLTVQKSGAFLLLEGFSMALQGCIGLLVLAVYHPVLMIFDLIIILWLGVVILVQGRKGVDTAIQESVAKYSVVAWLETLARHPQTFKFAGGPEFAQERTDRLAYDYLNARKWHYRILLKQHISLYALYALAGTTLLAVGGVLVMEGQLSLGQLVAAELIVSGVLLSFSKFKKQLENYYDLMAGVDKLGHLLDLPVERETGEPLDHNQPLSVFINDVSFRYPNGPELFHNINYKIKAGEKVALFGDLGCGKTTLAELLTGLRLPDDGNIQIDNLDMRELSLDSLRKEIAMVGPSDVIEDTILENIRLGRPEISVNQIRATLDRLGLMMELDHIQEGIYTFLNVNGAPLSNSQIQKMLLARAIIGNPKLLILDGLLDDWRDFAASQSYSVLFDANAPWTLLVLTSSEKITQLCQRTITLN